MLPTSETGLLFEGSHASSVCTSVKSSMYMNMSTEHWWDYMDREDGYAVRKTRSNVAFPTTDLLFYCPRIEHGRTWCEVGG